MRVYVTAGVTASALAGSALGGWENWGAPATAGRTSPSSATMATPDHADGVPIRITEATASFARAGAAADVPPGWADDGFRLPTSPDELVRHHDDQRSAGHRELAALLSRRDPYERVVNHFELDLALAGVTPWNGNMDVLLIGGSTSVLRDVDAIDLSLMSGLVPVDLSLVGDTTGEP